MSTKHTQSPEERYVALLDELLKDIDIIDGDTQWREFEPDWCLQMMRLRRLAQKFRDTYSG